MVQNWGLQLVVQLLTVINPAVHGRVEDDDEAEDDDEGDGKVRIKKTNDDDLNKEFIIENLSRQSTCTNISREY